MTSGRHVNRIASLVLGATVVTSLFSSPAKEKVERGCRVTYVPRRRTKLVPAIDFVCGRKMEQRCFRAITVADQPSALSLMMSANTAEATPTATYEDCTEVFETTCVGEDEQRDRRT